VTRFCASFPFRFRDVARSRGARALAYLMAVTLALTNVLAVAMPSAMPHDVSAAHASDHAHCAHHDASHAQMSHAAESSCCLGKTCVCVHFCGDVLALCVLPAMIAPFADSSAAPPSRPYATISSRFLRPPIA